MSILILTLCLSHCVLSTTDVAIGLGGGLFTAVKDKPSPVSVIKIIMKKNKKDE